MKITLFVLQIYLQDPSDVDLSNYQPHHAWELDSTRTKRNVQHYDCCPEPYMDVTFLFVLRRRPGFFRDLYIIPAILLASLVPFIFALPVTRVHRYVLGEELRLSHDSDVIMSAIAFKISCISIVCSVVCSGAHQRNHRNSALLAFVRGNPPVTSGFTSQKANNMEYISIWWHHHTINSVDKESSSNYITNYAL